MNLNENFPVSQHKIEELKKRILQLRINLSAIEEQFTRGTGHGGQKINKTSNCVILRYSQLELVVKMQQSRQRSLNRFLALRELVDQIEIKISPQTSQRLKEIEKIRKQKARRFRRHLNRKMGSGLVTEGNPCGATKDPNLPQSEQP